MLNEFCSLTGLEEGKFKDTWAKYEKLVIKYAPLEQKKTVKSLLRQYQSNECDNAGRCYVCILCMYMYSMANAELLMWRKAELHGYAPKYSI